MLLFLLSLFFNHINASCMEMIEISNKKNLIYTFTNEKNHRFPKNYEYCIKISNKSAAIFMNNAAASVSVKSGSSKTSLKLNKKSLGYYFLPTEQDNIINFKMQDSKSPFSVSFVSFPDNCDVQIVSNFPEKLISALDYNLHSLGHITKPKTHICYFSGFPFEAKFKYDETIEKKHSLKFTSSQNTSFEQIIENNNINDPSQQTKVNVVKFASPTLIEWDASNDDLNNFQIQMNEEKYNYSLNSGMDRDFNRITKIHQILNEKDRIITGRIKYKFDKSLLLIIIAVFALAFLIVIIIMVIVLHQKGMCCVKKVSPIEEDTDNWEISIDPNENELVYRRPYTIEEPENPYSSDKQMVNMIKKGTKSLNPNSLIIFKDSISSELLPNASAT